MRNRITWLDNMRGFMIIFVVLCHSLILDKNMGLQGHIDSFILYIITLFIMPCFFAISGFLYNKIQSYCQYRILWYKKGLGLLLPYIIFSLILHPYMHSPNSWISILYQPIFLMWFLYALFFIFIIVGTLDLFNVPVIIQTIIYIMAMLTQTRLSWFNGPDYDMNPLSCIFGYLIFFYLGFLIKSHYKSIKNILSEKVITALLFIILAIGIFIQVHYTGIFPYNTDGVQLSDILTKIISTLAFFSLFMTFDKIHIKWLNTVGKNTLIIYLVHYFALHTTFIWLMTHTIIRSPIIQSGIRFTSGMLGSLIIMQLAKHVKIIKVLFYPRNWISKRLR